MQEEMMRKSDPDFIVTRGRLEIVYGNGWWGDILMSMNSILIKEGDPRLKSIWRGHEPTMATDGKDIYICESYIRKLSFKQMLYVFDHEAVHKALGHCIRMRRLPNRDIANICTDVIANYICDQIADTGAIVRPPGGVYLSDVHHMFDIPKGVHWKSLGTDFSVEELYRMFVRKNGESPSGLPKPGFGYIIDPTDENGNELDDSKLDQMEVDQIVQTAAAVQRGGSTAGVGSGHIKNILDRMRRPKVDWRNVAHEFIASAKPSRTTWSRLNKRLRRFARLPSILKQELGTLLVFRDTSGSVGDEWQEAFLGFLNNLSRRYSFDEIITVPVDYDVHEDGIQRFKNGSVITTAAINGRGGTCFVRAFKWLDARTDIKPDRIIYMTDLEGQFLESPYKVPVLWVSSTRHKAPWGRTVQIEM